MNLLFYLSGEHPLLAEAEVRALFETYRKKWKRLFFQNQIAIYEVDFFCELRRLALTHKILNVDFSLEKKPFRVRVKRIASHVNTMELEREIAGKLQEEYGRIPVNLEHPEQEVYCIVQEEKTFVGLTLMDFPASWEGRKPQYRPYFHPSSLHPRVARALVNLGRARLEVLDPFCGTGGILLEAGLMGLRVYGMDISREMVEGTKQNLEHFGVTQYTVCEGDALRIREYFPRVEAVVTDMPYGKASRAVPSAEDLYVRTFSSLEGVTEKACVVCGVPYAFDEMGIRVREHFVWRVHRSLDRHIYTLDLV